MRKCSAESLSLRCSDSPAVDSVNFWGLAFRQEKPWPKLAHIVYYDISEDERTSGLVEFRVENGWAKYAVEGECPDSAGLGRDFHCRLVDSEWRK